MNKETYEALKKTEYEEEKDMKTFILNISREEYGFIRIKAKNKDEARELFLSGDNWDDINWNNENVEIQKIEKEK